jgi:hypothetical protein
MLPETLTCLTRDLIRGSFVTAVQGYPEAGHKHSIMSNCHEIPEAIMEIVTIVGLPFQDWTHKAYYPGVAYIQQWTHKTFPRC